MKKEAVLIILILYFLASIMATGISYINCKHPEYKSRSEDRLGVLLGITFYPSIEVGKFLAEPVKEEETGTF